VFESNESVGSQLDRGLLLTDWLLLIENARVNKEEEHGMEDQCIGYIEEVRLGGDENTRFLCLLSYHHDLIRPITAVPEEHFPSL
jgi:hypothetical protein